MPVTLSLRRTSRSSRLCTVANVPSVEPRACSHSACATSPVGCLKVDLDAVLEVQTSARSKDPCNVACLFDATVMCGKKKHGRESLHGAWYRRSETARNSDSFGELVGPRLDEAEVSS